MDSMMNDTTGGDGYYTATWESNQILCETACIEDPMCDYMSYFNSVCFRYNIDESRFLLQNKSNSILKIKKCQESKLYLISLLLLPTSCVLDLIDLGPQLLH